MAEAVLSFTAFSEQQRTQALERFEIIRPALEKEVSHAQVVRTHHLAPSTVQLWIKQYREKGLAGLAKPARRSEFTRNYSRVQVSDRRSIERDVIYYGGSAREAVPG